MRAARQRDRRAVAEVRRCGRRRRSSRRAGGGEGGERVVAGALEGGQGSSGDGSGTGTVALQGRGRRTVSQRRPAGPARPYASKAGVPAGSTNRNCAPPAGAAPDLDAAAVGLDQALDDVEPEAGAAAAVAAAPEAGEDPRRGLLGDALALVGDGRRAGAVAVAGPTVTVTVPSPWRRAFSTRLPTTCWSLSGSTHISGSSPRDVDDERSSGSPAGDLPGDGLAHGGRQVDDLLAHLEPAGVDAADVEQLGDQPGDAVGVGVDRLEHDLLLVVVEAVPLGQQRRGEALDAGQRRAQLVRDGARRGWRGERSSRSRARVSRSATTSRVEPAVGAADVGRGDEQVAAAVRPTSAAGTRAAGVRLRSPPYGSVQAHQSRPCSSCSGSTSRKSRPRAASAVVPSRRSAAGLRATTRAVGVGDDDAVGQVVVRRLVGLRHAAPPSGCARRRSLYGGRGRRTAARSALRARRGVEADGGGGRRG